MNLVLEVTIPMLPPSVNAIYAPVNVGPTSSRRGFSTIKMRREAVEWIGQAGLFLPPCKLRADVTYRMELEYHANWRTKSGELKNKDVRNYEKLVTDTVFRRYGLSDKLIWESLVTKVQSPDKDKVLVKLFEL